MKIISKEKNPFLEREEMSIAISGTTMPTKKEIIEGLGKDEKLCIIRKIDSRFGRDNFVADVVVYDSEVSKNKYVTIPKKVKAKMELERKAAVEEARKKAIEEAKLKETENSVKQNSEGNEN